MISIQLLPYFITFLFILYYFNQLSTILNTTIDWVGKWEVNIVIYKIAKLFSAYLSML